MIERIIRYSIQHKLVVGLGVLLLIALGVRAMMRLPVDAVPDITNNQVQVITIAPTLATLEVEQFVSYPIEQALSNLPEVHELRSISRFGVSQVTVVFDDAFDTYLARQLVAERLQLVRGDMPDGVQPPYLAPLSTGLGEVYQYVVHPKPGFEDRFTPMELREVQDWIIARRLMGTPGVAEINSFGGFLKQFEVAVDPLRLQGMGLSIGDLLTALERNNANTGGAYIERSNNAYYIRGLGLARTLDDIGRIVVDTPEEGAPLLVRDVAEVRLGHAPRYGAMTRNGEGEVVGGIVMMRKGENASKVVDAVKERMKSVEAALPEGLQIDPFLDRADLVSRAIATVEKNLLEGALIVVLVLVLFLGQWRAGLIVASVIPLAMLFALIMMDLTGVTGNLMSLGAIDFGLIVDGAVIIVEAVLHRMQHLPASGRLDRERMDHEVSGAASRMMNAATFGQLIILIVYLPILALSGVEGKMFRPMAQTVSYAILGAIILSLTYVPVMSALFVPRRTGPSRNFSDRMMEAVGRAYRPTLELALRFRRGVVIGALGLLALAVAAFLRMGGEFIPQLEEGDFAFHSILPQGSSLTASVRNNALVEERLMAFPEVKMVVGKSGTAEVPTDLMSPEQTDVMILLNPRDAWTTTDDYWSLADSLLAALQEIPGVFFEINQPIQMRFNELMTGVRQDIAIKVYGPDLDSLVHYAERIAHIVRDVPGAGPPQVERVAGLPQIAVRYDRERLAATGFSVDQLNRTVRAAFAGEPAGAIYEHERRFDLVVRADSSRRSDITDVGGLYVANDRGERLPLSQVADVRYEDAPAQVTHEDAQRRIFVGVNARGRDVERLVADIEEQVAAQVDLPPGYFVSFGGQFENLVEAKRRLSLVVPLALALILALLYFTFRSLPSALLIFTAVPLSAIGGVAALLLRGMPFSISAGVGFIALFGVAVLNGMVLISTFQQLREEGVDDVWERVRQGTRMRLRPVLMTASVASLGFLPMALSSSAGAEVQRPLATVVIGGLITATLLTLVVLPALYVLFFGSRRARAPKALAVLLPLLLLGGVAQAQTPLVLSLDSALSIARMQAPALRAAVAEELRADALRRTATEMPATELEYMRGQYNSYVPDDNNITIKQRIPFPTLMAARGGAARAGAEVARADRMSIEADLRMAVQRTGLRLRYLQALDSLMERTDSVYEALARSAGVRHEAGAGSLLERTTALARASEVHTRRMQVQADRQVEQYRLGALLGMRGPVDASPGPLRALPTPMGADTAVLALNPDLVRLEQQAEVARQEHRVARNAMLPDLMVGYFNQTLIDAPTTAEGLPLAAPTDRFDGFMAGVSVPLWFVPGAAKAKAGAYREESARQAWNDARLQLMAEHQALLLQEQRDRALLRWYEQEALPNAERILATSLTAFEVGEIGQAEHLLNLQQANTIFQEYLRTVDSLNGTVLQLERITVTGR